MIVLTEAICVVFSGIISIPGAGGGLILGGFIIKRFQMSVSTILKWQTIFNVLTLTTIFMFFINCNPLDFAGINTPYINR